MNGNQRPYFKYCIVPMCKNTRWNAPDKVFFHVPRDANVRQKWCNAVGREIISTKSTAYCCEDHFDIEKDTENYMQFKIMRSEGRTVVLRLKKDVSPHIFQCHVVKLKTSNKIFKLKRKKKVLTKEFISEHALKQLQESSLTSHDNCEGNSANTTYNLKRLHRNGKAIRKSRQEMTSRDFDIVVKVECDPCVNQRVIETEDTIDKMMNTSTPALVAIERINVEYDAVNQDITNQEYISAEHTTSGDTVCRSTTTEVAIHDIKAENDHDVECVSATTKEVVTDDVKLEVVQEIITPEEFTNIDMMARSLPIVAFNSIKVEDCGVIENDTFLAVALQRNWRDLRDGRSEIYDPKKSICEGAAREEYRYFNQLSFLDRNEQRATCEQNDDICLSVASKNTKKRYIENCENEILQRISDSLKHKHATRDTHTHDPDKDFLMSMLPDIRKIPDDLKLDFKADLMQLIKKYKMLKRR